jgi:hypothetical protein
MLGLFFFGELDRFKEGVRHMPALQLAGRQFIGGILYVSFSCTKKGSPKENNGKQSSF